MKKTIELTEKEFKTILTSIGTRGFRLERMALSEQKLFGLTEEYRTYMNESDYCRYLINELKQRYL